MKVKTIRDVIIEWKDYKKDTEIEIERKYFIPWIMERVEEKVEEIKPKKDEEIKEEVKPKKAKEVKPKTKKVNKKK